MTHPGLPFSWATGVWVFMLGVTLWCLYAPAYRAISSRRFDLVRMPMIGAAVHSLMRGPWVLLTLKIVVVALFLLVLIAGLAGTPIPERNLATLLTWNIWWTGLIISIFFLGSAWCAVCPWDTLATWLVRRRLWRRADPNNSLNLRVPKQLRNVWPALLMLIGLTWLELGVGVTVDPYATALLALFMVVLAVASLAVFERRAFCRYFCPVGRAVGFYAQLAPVELRPIESDICARCTSLACFHGDPTTEPCPTHLLMGTLKQNTYCTSCGYCTQSCPHDNVTWRLRSPSVEAIQDARPHWDEAWFMLGLLALTLFHGLTMLPFWEIWVSATARIIGDSGLLLWSFSVGFAASITVPLLLYLFTITATYYTSDRSLPFKRLFASMAFVSLPLAFAYHLAHNLTHLVREGDGFGAVLVNPLGTGTLPLSMLEKHLRHVTLMIPQDALFAIQAALLGFGFWIAVKVIVRRGGYLLDHSDSFASRWRIAPMMIFALTVTGFNVWLMTQPMTMRM